MVLIKSMFLPVMLVVLLVAITCSDFDQRKKAENKISTDSKGFAVIELFTSEGCSSCPSADELVSKILKENKQDVYILSFHVDYWNRLGWKDNFSQAAFSDRQQQYAKYLLLDGVYTPQIVVNGTDQFVGSDENHLRSSLNKGIKQASDFTIEASHINNETIHIVYKTEDNNSQLINIALIQPEASTEVKRGENGGRILHHVNIVRGFKTIEATSTTGNLDIEIPTELRNQPFKVIAYIQKKNTFQITGAAQTTVQVSLKHT